jgi:C1A family cysteine protease
VRIKHFGWVRDIPDQRDFRYVPPARLTRALPVRVDLRSGFPDCYNQGRLGSCTANAISGALQFLERKEGAPEPVMPSRLFIYFNERELEGTVDSDSGAQIRDGIKSVVKRGFCPEDAWPYDIRKFAVKPPERCYRAARKDRVSEYLRLDNNAPVPLLTCLASGYPFVFGFSVYESFESPQVEATGVVPMPRMGERVLGGHAVVACGYDLKAARFIVRNSWGARWGMSGYCTMPFAYLTHPFLTADFWTIRRVPI